MPPSQSAALDFPLFNGARLWEFCSVSRTGRGAGVYSGVTHSLQDVLSLPGWGAGSPGHSFWGTGMQSPMTAPKGPVDSQ